MVWGAVVSPICHHRASANVYFFLPYSIEEYGMTLHTHMCLAGICILHVQSFDMLHMKYWCF